MDWAHDYFERGYAQRWTLGSPSAETARDALALRGHLRLSADTTLLDAACGHGRHALALADTGARVIGIDFASALLARAVELSEGHQPIVGWVRGDIRQLPIQTRSIQAGLLFDAFGFFESDVEDQLVVSELARVIAPRGRLALKVANPEPMLADFRAHDREIRTDAVIEVRRSLEANPPRLIETLEIRGPRGSGTYQRRQRLYRPREVLAALQAVGFTPILTASSASGAPFEARSSASLVVVAERDLPQGESVRAPD